LNRPRKNYGPIKAPDKIAPCYNVESWTSQNFNFDLSKTRGEGIIIFFLLLCINILSHLRKNYPSIAGLAPYSQMGTYQSLI
jgi:hypothetical protein